MSDWKADRIGAALRGENPTVLMRLSASFAVIGDVQFLPGYCLVISDDPGSDRLADLPLERRLAFLADMDLLGVVMQRVLTAREPGFRRLNYEIQGNHDAFVHAHIWPRYHWEPAELQDKPVARYDLCRWHDPDPVTLLGPQHDELRAALTGELQAEVHRRERNR